MLDSISLREAVDLGAETIAFPKADLKLVHEITQANFHCMRCGTCCRGGLGLKRLYLSPADIKRLAKGLGLSKKAVKKMTFTKDKQRWLPLPCQFQKGNDCDIHDYRPDSCRGFPILDEVIANGEKCVRLYIGEKCSGMKNMLRNLP